MSELKGMVVFAVSEPLEDGSFFIKKSIRDGSLAIFDEEKDAGRQLRRNDIQGNVVNELVVVRQEVVANVVSKLKALTEINRLQSEENKQLAEDNAKLREALQEVDAGLINRSVVDAFKTCENQGLSIEDCLHDAILTYFENLTAEIDG